MTVYKLRKIYKQQKIRKKVLSKTKIPSVPKQWDIMLQVVYLSNDVRVSNERGFRIVQLDEFMVTKRTLPTHVWSPKLENAKIDMGWIKSECKAVVIAVSKEMGLEHIEVF